jgi:hypothetical protein
MLMVRTRKVVPRSRTVTAVRAEALAQPAFAAALAPTPLLHPEKLLEVLEVSSSPTGAIRGRRERSYSDARAQRDTPRPIRNNTWSVRLSTAVAGITSRTSLQRADKLLQPMRKKIWYR